MATPSLLKELQISCIETSDRGDVPTIGELESAAVGPSPWTRSGEPKRLLSRDDDDAILQAFEGAVGLFDRSLPGLVSARS